MATTFGRVKGTFALLGVVSIGVIYAIVTGWNPLPGWANWVQNVTVTKLATPAPIWTVRVGNQPYSATVLSDSIVVSTGGSVEVRNPGTGQLVWSREDSWAGVAGDAQAVVLVGRPVKAGFDVYDAGSGVLLWSVNERAGVWAYQDKVLILICGKTCTLKAVSTARGQQLWSTTIDANGSGLMGFDQGLAGIGSVDSAYDGPTRAVPAPAPGLLGLPMGGKIHVIDTHNGHALHVFTPSGTNRIAVAGDAVISSSATTRGDQCYYTAAGLDPGTGTEMWQQSGLDLRTSTPLGCESAKDPIGSGGDVLATDTAGRDVIIDAASGHVKFRAGVGERIVAMDTQVAIVRASGNRAFRAVNVSDGHQLWQTTVPKTASIGLAAAYVVVVDPAEMGTISISTRQTGTTVSTVKSDASVLGFGPVSLVINIGRTIGPISVSASP